MLGAMPADLVFDNRTKLEGQPACHAFIVGVDNYPHLVGGKEAGSAEMFGIGQLTSAVNSAVRFCEWLIDRGHTLRAPLGTCRLLLSAEPRVAFRGRTIEPATIENVLREAAEWRRDAGAHRDGITM